MDTKEEIRRHLTYLTKHLTNLLDILLCLVENNIISNNEKEEIESGKTTEEKNSKLLFVIQRKDLPLRMFLDILRDTRNEHCADKIEGISSQKEFKRNPRKILKNIWWPDNKLLIPSLYKRKIGDKSLVEELHEKLLNDSNRMVVITESLNASKVTGLGGVGKTLTSKWYAHEFEKEYDHVVWVDCGEGSLLISFQKLARDLEVKNRNELEDLEDYARKCYESLQEFKCLWIFDNAESYKGAEGIQNILPKLKLNFYCLITSRCRDWGSENGFSISRLELNVFRNMESLEFLKINLKIEYKDEQLKELRLLLGNLPLAMQLAVSALNNGKIEMRDYIQKTAKVDLENIINVQFDDYERTINKNVTTSLDLIAKEKHGEMAKELLTIFGYIRPDYVQSKFLMKIMKVDVNTLKEAIDLLVKYSLISRSGTVQETPYDDGILDKILGRNKEKVEMNLLSIHRLLQQVIRHNGKTTKKKSLRQILGCKRFVDYKIIPFIKYANDELRKEFPKVKAQLLDSQQLKKLLISRRFEESVQLSKFVHQEINTITSEFNYAVCLDKSGKIEEAADVFKRFFMATHENDDDKTIAAKIFAIYMESKMKTGEYDLIGPEIPLLNHNFPTLLNEAVDDRRITAKTDSKWTKLLNQAVEYGKIVDLSVRPTKGQIAYFVFHLHFQLGKNENVLKEKVHSLLKIVSSVEILSYLILTKVFAECALISRIIDQELNTNATKFNYAICLELNGQVEENIKVLEELYQELILEIDDDDDNDDYDNVEMGLLMLNTEVTKELVGGHLMISHWNMDNTERMQEILQERKSFKMIASHEMMSSLMKILNSSLIQSNYNLVLIPGGSGWTFKIDLESDAKKILMVLTVHLSIPLPNDLKELVLLEVMFINGTRKTGPTDISEWLPKKLNRFSISAMELGPKISQRIILSLESISSIQDIDLANCSLSLDSGNRISPSELKLLNVSFVKNGHELSNVNINEFIDFHNMNRLELYCYSKNKLLIDLSGESANMEYLELHNVNVVSLKSANGRVNIKQARISHCSLDLSILPSSLENLGLLSKKKIFVSGGIDLPNLKCLESKYISHLSHFRSLQLTHLYLRGLEELNLDILPSTIKIIRLNKTFNRTFPDDREGERSLRLIKGGVRDLERLILCDFSLNEVVPMLARFQLKQLVLHDDTESYKPDDLIQLMDKQIPTIAVGKVFWGKEFSNYILSKQVDRQSEYYAFHENTGKSVEEKDFLALYLLKNIFG